MNAPSPRRGRAVRSGCHRSPRWVSIRPIQRSDEPGLTSFYAQLSPESHRRRFLASARRSRRSRGHLHRPLVAGRRRDPGTRPARRRRVAHASSSPMASAGRGGIHVADALQATIPALVAQRSHGSLDGTRPCERQHARRQRGDAASPPPVRLRRAQRPHGRRRGGGHPPARLLAGPSRSKRPGATGRSALTTVPRRSVHSIRNTAGLRSTDAPHARLLRRLHRHGHPLPRDDPRHRPGDERHGTAVRNARRRFLSAGERGRRPGRRDCDPRLRPRVRAGDGRRAGAGSIHGDLHERRRHRAQRDLRGRHDGQCRRAPVRDRRGRHSGRRV